MALEVAERSGLVTVYDGIEQAVCSRMEDLAKHLIQYSARYKRLRTQATDADRAEGSAFEHEWKRKFLASITPGNDPELRLEVQVIREMALDTVAGKSVTTMTEKLKRREAGIIVFD